MPDPNPAGETHGTRSEPAVTAAELAEIIIGHVREGLSGHDVPVPYEDIDAAVEDIMGRLAGGPGTASTAGSRVDLTELYPQGSAEPAGAWTDRLLSHAGEHGTYRQCSIGWHGDCSQRSLAADAECNCLCHGAGVQTYSVEGHAEDSTVTVTRVEAGRHHWPPVAGEPATVWAMWLLAASPEEAASKAVSLQDKARSS